MLRKKYRPVIKTLLKHTDRNDLRNRIDIEIINRRIR